MSAPDTCPKCEAGNKRWDFRTGSGYNYACGTLFEESTKKCVESRFCITAQRDQLAERVKLIEIERDELKVKVSFDELALQKMEERVKRLEEAGDAMANAYEEILWDNHDATILENYRKVRSGEGKP